MRRRASRPHEGRPLEGFAAIELTLSVAVLVIPVLLLVATLPTWVERRHVGVLAATEAARAAARAYPDTSGATAHAVVAEVGARGGLDPGDLRLDLDIDARRGGTIVATVTVRMPAVVVPALGTLDAWEVRVVATRRIEDHRSR